MKNEKKQVAELNINALTEEIKKDFTIDFKKLEIKGANFFTKQFIEDSRNKDVLFKKEDLQDFLIQWVNYKETTSILKLCFNTGLVWLKCIYTIGTEQDDIIGTIEEYINNNPNDISQYDYEELLRDYNNEEIDENYIAINGGEFYIDTLELIEEINYSDYVEILKSGV